MPPPAVFAVRELNPREKEDLTKKKKGEKGREQELYPLSIITNFILGWRLESGKERKERQEKKKKRGERKAFEHKETSEKNRKREKKERIAALAGPTLSL